MGKLGIIVVVAVLAAIVFGWDALFAGFIEATNVVGSMPVMEHAVSEATDYIEHTTDKIIDKMVHEMSDE